MRRTSAVLLAPLLAVALLSGCGAGSAKSSGAAKTQLSKDGLPSVSGSYGSKPTFTFPTPTAPAGLKSQVLREGTGPVVQKGDLLVADYLGQVWGGKVFDNSYDRKTVAGFVIGTGKVITGWDDVLVGAKAGSRVLMSLPPDKGYGAKGNSRAGISGTDTLVFIVDIVSSYGGKVAGDPKAVVQKASHPGVTVAGPLGGIPTVAVAKGAAAPKAPVVTLLAKGSGAPVSAGLIIVQYVATTFDGKTAGSTFNDGAPAAVPVSAGGNGTPFDAVKGLPLGSRLLLTVPGTNGQQAIAVAVDLIAQPKTAAETG